MIKTQKNQGKNLYIRFSLLFLTCYLLFISCDLFTGPKTDLFQVISDEVDWANAPKLTVSVHTGEWGRSPQEGEGKCGDTRKGYEFGVEFTPLSAYGFEKWLAFPTAGFAEWFDLNKYKSSYNADVTAYALNDNGVTITEGVSDTGAKTAKVTINMLEPVTLVPWCGDRPRVVQANPPLISSGITYPRGQEIRIVFSTELEYANTVPFGEGYIQISGTNISDGSLLNGHGDLTGLTDSESRYFNAPVYNSNVITIKPIEAKLPPANMVITVMAGTNIIGKNGNGLAAPVAFSYTTDDRQIIRIYQANQIWALHPDAVNPETEFFHQMADRQLDRRIRKTANGDYAVTLYFNVSPSAQDMSPLPDTIDIVELEYATPTGSEMYDNVGKEVRRMLIANPSAYVISQNDTAGSIYHNANSGGEGYYKIEYNWGKTPPASGIYRLAALPYRKGGGTVVEPQSIEGVIAQLRYITVAFDNLPPGGEAEISLSGNGGVTGNVYNYSNTPETKTLRLSANFRNVRDNSGEGIRLMNHTSNKPWTMDDQSALSWRFRIVTDSTVNYPSGSSDDWIRFSADNTGTAALDLSGVADLALNGGQNIERALQIQYKDNLGNITTPWETIARFKYYTPAINPVSGWNAYYYDADADEHSANTIEVSWTNGSGMTGVEVYVDDQSKQKSNANDYKITDVPKIDDSEVRNNRPTDNIKGYTIVLRAYNDFGFIDTEVKIWNIPGMKVSNIDPAVEVRTAAELAAMKDGLGRQYVLAMDITVTGAWTPVGSTDTSPFAGKLYGNGHKITFDKESSIGGNTYRGLFGYAQEAVIRDLTFEYNAPAISISVNSNIGGIAGFLKNTTVSNIITLGGTLIINASGTGTVNLGGIVGNVEGSKIENCHAALSTKYTSTQHVGNVNVGAIAGMAKSGIGNWDFVINNGTGNLPEPYLFLNKVTVAANVSVNDISDRGEINIGGVVGMNAKNILNKITFTTGIISFSGNLNGNYACGGIIGVSSNASIVECLFLGDIVTSGTTSVTDETSIGGLVGNNYDDNSSFSILIHECRVRGNIKFTGNSNYTKIAGIFGHSEKKFSNNFIYITNSSFEDGNIDVTVTTGTSVNIGGFFGEINGVHYMIRCGALKGTITVSAPGNLKVGGFTSFFTGTMGRGMFSNVGCFSMIDVIVKSSGSSVCNVGGFIGELTLGSEISNCYATGTVSVVTKSINSDGNSSPPCVGGLVGISKGNITDCYALGNVVVSDSGTNGPVAVGGLVGSNLGDFSYWTDDEGKQQTSYYGIIDHNFSAGTVSAQAQASTTEVYSGGIVGYSNSSQVTNTAALGASVTAKGGTKAVGRIYGKAEKLIPQLTILSIGNNMAKQSMRVEEGAYGDTLISNTAPTGAGDAAGQHGQTINDSAFFTHAFWTSLNFTTEYATWDFSRVAKNGYPRLAWEQ